MIFRFFLVFSLVVHLYNNIRMNTLEIYTFIPTQVESVDCQKNEFRLRRQFPHLPVNENISSMVHIRTVRN